MTQKRTCKMCELTVSTDEMLRTFSNGETCKHKFIEMTQKEVCSLESMIAQEIGYISGIFMSQGDTKAKDMVMPTSELKEMADRINLYYFAELTSQRESLIEKIKSHRKQDLDWRDNKFLCLCGAKSPEKDGLCAMCRVPYNQALDDLLSELSQDKEEK